MFDPDDNIPNLRSATIAEEILDTYLPILQRRVHGTIGDAKVLLRVHGLAAVKSPLWDLLVYKKHFFQRMGICGIHLLALGQVKRMFLYTAWILPKDSLKGTDFFIYI